MSELFAVLVLGGLIFAGTLVVGAFLGRERERRKRFEALAPELESPVIRLDGVAGVRRGRQVVLRYMPHRRQSDSTEVEVTTAPLGVELSLRRQDWLDGKLVAHGLAVDVQVGDQEFDRTFLVEAAPGEVIRRVLDESIRRRILPLGNVTVRTIASGLMITTATWTSDAMSLEMIDLAVDLVERIEQEVEASKLPGESTGEPYRSAPPPRVTPPAHAHEIANLRSRTDTRQWRVIIGALIVVSLLVGFTLLGHC